MTRPFNDVAGVECHADPPASMGGLAQQLQTRQERGRVLAWLDGEWRRQEGFVEEFQRAAEGAAPAYRAYATKRIWGMRAVQRALTWLADEIAGLDSAPPPGGALTMRRVRDAATMLARSLLRALADADEADEPVSEQAILDAAEQAWALARLVAGTLGAPEEEVTE